MLISKFMEAKMAILFDRRAGDRGYCGDLCTAKHNDRHHLFFRVGGHGLAVAGTADHTRNRRACLSCTFSAIKTRLRSNRKRITR
jgi:hypothetical protein